MKITREKNRKVVRVVEEMKKVRVKVLREDKWQIEGNLVLKKRKVYMPKNEELRVEIIQLYHDVLVVEYRGRQKTAELMIKNYWWLSVTKDNI